MSRKTVVTTFVLILMLSMIAQTLVMTTSAQYGPTMNSGPDFTPLSITVISPLKNQVYSPDVELKFTVTKPASWFTYNKEEIFWNYGCQGKVNFVRYSLDGQPTVTLPANDTFTGKGGLSSKTPFPTTLNYIFPFKGFSQGLHTISLSVEGQYYYWTSNSGDINTNIVVGNTSKILFYVNGDQYTWGGSVSAPEGSIPPKITIYSPNSTVFTSNNVSLSFKATTSKDASVLTDVWYQVAWQKNNTSEYHLNNTSSSNFFNDTLTGMSDGNHTITVFASGAGSFVSENTFYVYDIGSSSSVSFVVDSINPTISFATTQNKTFDTAKVVLDFSVNKPVSQIIYSLDNHGNVTTNSNVSLTLDNLPIGEHNVTIYAKDEYGIISAPNTIYFSVKVFPIEIVLVVSVAVALVLAGLLVYHKKHKRTLVKEV
jgi:hypothetical protein